MPNRSNVVRCTVIPSAKRLVITVRSPKHEKVLRKEWEEAEKVGVDFSHMQWGKPIA